MNEKKANVPKIRFPGFTDAWEQRRLGETAKITMGQSPDGANYTSNSSDYILVQGNADLKNGFVFPRVYTTQITKTANAGDIILSVRAPVGDVGKTDYNVVLGRGVAGIHANEFIFQTLVKMKDFGFWNKISTGSTFESINSNDLKNAEIYIPSNEEQQQIGTFFKTIDNLITLHQRKLDNLKEQKKTLLNKMFPKDGESYPEIRFPNFTDPWEQRKLENALIKNSQKNKDLAIDNIESVSNKTGFTKQTEQFDDYTVASADLSNYYVISEKQFAYNPSRINVGSIAYKQKGEEISIVSPLYVSFSTKEKLNDTFLWNWFKTSAFEKQRQRLSEGGVRDTLSFNQLSKMELLIPRVEEQTKIGQFFTNLDNLITLHQRKLDNLKELKKSLLHDMFV